MESKQAGRQDAPLWYEAVGRQKYQGQTLQQGAEWNCGLNKSRQYAGFGFVHTEPNMSAPALCHCLTLPPHSFDIDVDPSLLQPPLPSTALNPHPHHCNVYTDQRGTTAPPWTRCVKRANNSCTCDLLICLCVAIVSSLGKKIRWTCMCS